MKLRISCKQLPDHLRRLLRGQSCTIEAEVFVTEKYEGEATEYSEEYISFDIVGDKCTVSGISGDGTNMAFQEAKRVGMRTMGVNA